MVFDAVIFDFDGVICESIEVKKEAFRKLFQDHPQYLNQIVEYHMINGGISRYEKFKTIYRDFLKLELTEEKSKELGRRFSEYAYDLVLNSEFVRGAFDFLEKYYQKLPLFIVSGTPHEEMELIVKKRDLNKYFKGVYGSPTKKSDLISKILDTYEIEPKKAVFVGDSINDYVGAKDSGAQFIGRVHPNYPNPFEGVEVYQLINDLTELEQWIKNQ